MRVSVRPHSGTCDSSPTPSTVSGPPTIPCALTIKLVLVWGGASRGDARTVQIRVCRTWYIRIRVYGTCAYTYIVLGEERKCESRRLSLCVHEPGRFDPRAENTHAHQLDVHVDVRSSERVFWVNT